MSAHSNGKADGWQGASGKLADTAAGKLTVGTDMAVRAGRRAPEPASRNLSAAEVAIEQGRLRLNDFLQSAPNPAVRTAEDPPVSGRRRP